MKNFNDIYEEIYKKSYAIIEEEKNNVKKRMKIICTLVIIMGIIILSSSYENRKIAIVIGIVLAFICMVIHLKNSKYNVAYKQLVIKEFIEQYDAGLAYRSNVGIASTLYRMGEFEGFDKYNSEDYIRGTLNNKINIEMSEVHTQREEIDNEGNTHYSTVFHGLFVKVDIGKIINASTKIRRNKLKLIDRKDSLSMDSGEFERIFDVYSDGKIETMQILTLDIMQKMIDFKNKTRITPEFTIKDNSIYIRFHMGNVFEANIMKSGLDYETLKKYFDILNFIQTISEDISKNIEEAGI